MAALVPALTADAVSPPATLWRRLEEGLLAVALATLIVLPLLEMVRSFLTSEEVYQTSRAFGESLGKTVVVAKDKPGFIVNALLIPYLLDAIRMYEEGTASREDIDTGIRLGLNHPMGPLTLTDFVGLDTTLFVADAMFEETKNARYAAPTLLRRMVTAGHMGRKSGKGFYEYK